MRASPHAHRTSPPAVHYPGQGRLLSPHRDGELRYHLCSVCREVVRRDLERGQTGDQHRVVQPPGPPPHPWRTQSPRVPLPRGPEGVPRHGVQKGRHAMRLPFKLHS